MARRAHLDRQDNPRSETDKQRILEAQVEHALRADVAAIHAHLVDTEPTYSTVDVSADEVTERVVAVYRADVTAFRCWRMTDALHAAFASKSAERKLDGKGFRELASSGLDIEHAAVGAAYCDVFTCDRLTSSWIGRRRDQLGLNPQLARGEFASDEAFVDALERFAP